MQPVSYKHVAIGSTIGTLIGFAVALTTGSVGPPYGSMIIGAGAGLGAAVGVWLGYEKPRN